MREDRFSRISSAIASLGTDARPHGFGDRHVLLTGEVSVLGTENGRLCLLDAVRLLVRMSGHLEVNVPGPLAQLKEQAIALGNSLGEPDVIRVSSDPPESYDAILSVGTSVRQDLPWTVVNSNGWLARVSSHQPIAADTDQVNPVGAFAAACLGVAEVFKRLVCLRSSRGALANALSFSLETYACGSDDPGFRLPREIAVDALLAGAGAIGNAVGLLLSQLPLAGRILIVDEQRFTATNLGTCVLMESEDLGAPKAQVLASRLGSKVSATGEEASVRDLGRRLWRSTSFPRVVLGALDSVVSRHDAQDLWPDVLIDGALGQFLAQVSVHPWGVDVACARCMFREEPGQATEEFQSEATGLSIERLRDPESLVTANDIVEAPESRREWLHARLGRTTCSVASEAAIQKLGSRPPAATVTVPFVPGLSASMMVTELIKFATRHRSSLDTRFQFDALRGPVAGLQLPQGRNRKCLCVERSKDIELFRSQRRQSVTPR